MHIAEEGREESTGVCPSDHQRTLMVRSVLPILRTRWRVCCSLTAGRGTLLENILDRAEVKWLEMIVLMSEEGALH